MLKISAVRSPQKQVSVASQQTCRRVAGGTPSAPQHGSDVAQGTRSIAVGSLSGYAKNLAKYWRYCLGTNKVKVYDSCYQKTAFKLRRVVFICKNFWKNVKNLAKYRRYCLGTNKVKVYDSCYQMTAFKLRRVVFICKNFCKNVITSNKNSLDKIGNLSDICVRMI